MPTLLVCAPPGIEAHAGSTVGLFDIFDEKGNCAVQTDAPDDLQECAAAGEPSPVQLRMPREGGI